MTQRRRWGTDEHGVPRAWFAPLAGLVGMAAQLLFRVIVHSRVTISDLAAALVFALVFTVGLDLNRRRLQGQRPRDGSW